MGEFVEVTEARTLSGLRLVLSLGVPGPWSEAAKGILYVKKIPYVPRPSGNRWCQHRTDRMDRASDGPGRDLERRTAALNLDRTALSGRAP